VKPCAHILLELPVVDSNFLHGQPDVTGTGTMATKIVSIHKRVKRIYRVGQKVAHFFDTPYLCNLPGCNETDFTKMFSLSF